MRKAADLVVEEAKPIEMDRAEARGEALDPGRRARGPDRSRGSVDPRLLA